MKFKILKLDFYGEGWEKVKTSVPYRGLTLSEAKELRTSILKEEGSIKPIEVYIVIE